MPEFLRQLFSSGDYMPHGYCYMWNPGLVWLHVISDGLIAAAYFVIPVVLLGLVKKRRDIPFNWMFVCFGVFIVACGFTHAMEIWNLWHANYWLSGVIKAITAVASVGTAILFVQLVPKAMELPSPQAMQKVIDQLHQQAELLDLAHDAIFVRDLHGAIVYWNRGAEKLYGWTFEDACRRAPHDLLRTQFPQPLEILQTEVFETGSWEGELVHQTRDGKQVIVASRWSLRRGPDGRPVSILEVNRDITARKKAESKFRGLLEAAPDAMVIVDQQGRIVLANAQTQKLFGYSPNELLGQPVEILLPAGLQGKHAGHREDYFHTPHARAMGVGLELAGRRKDGSEFLVEISLSPLQTEEGILVTSAIRDISRRRQAEAALKDSEARLKLALESAQLGAWELDLVKDTAQRSLRHDQIFGYSTLQPQWGAQIFASHVFPEDRELAMARFSEAYSTGQFSMQCRIIWPDKSIHWIDAQGRVYRNGRGEPIRMSGVVADITSRKQIEEALERHRSELARSNAELAAANEDLESFTYSVSHDLRAPLRHIDGFSRILIEEHRSKLDTKGQHYLHRVAAGAQQMGRLVDDLLNLSRVGRSEIQFHPANLSAIAEAVRVDLAGLAPGRSIEWKIAPLPVIQCDPDLLKLVFTNLLSNAIKFSAPRERAIIEVGCAEEEREFVFFVRDNGVGFDPKYADKLFGVFQRLHSQEDFEGTGIGLATVQRIIRKHGGRIWTESAPNCGAAFFFTLGKNSDGLHELAAEKEGVI